MHLVHPRVSNVERLKLVQLVNLIYETLYIHFIFHFLNITFFLQADPERQIRAALRITPR